MAYTENSAPLRSKEAGAREFRALKGRLSLVFNEEAGARARAVKLWNNYVPLSPQTAFNILTRGLPEGTKIEFRNMSDQGNGYLKIFKYDEEEGGELLSDLRDFNFLAKEVGMGFVEVAERAQAQGLGRRLMRNQIEFFHACGVERFNIYASNVNGGYTWARMGFLPPDVTDKGFLAGIRKKVGLKLGVLAMVLPEDATQQVRDLMKFENDTDMWALADLELDVVPLVEGAVGKGGWLKGAAKDELLKVVGEDYEAFKKAGKPLPLGRVLLKGADWEGTLDLHDERQMKRVEKYCGGFDFIKS